MAPVSGTEYASILIKLNSNSMASMCSQHTNVQKN